MKSFLLEPDMDTLADYFYGDLWFFYRHSPLHLYIREDVSGLVYVLVSPYRMDICRSFDVLKNKLISQAVDFFGYSSNFFREETEEHGNDC